MHRNLNAAEKQLRAAIRRNPGLAVEVLREHEYVEYRAH
jgi:hypothetical protein